MTSAYSRGQPTLKIVVLRARSNRLADTIPLTPKILEILPYIENGTVTAIERAMNQE